MNFTIIVAGELGEQFDGAFAGTSLDRVAGTTRISGSLIDQAELQGLLRQIFDLGLELQWLATSPAEPPRPGHGRART